MNRQRFVLVVAIVASLALGAVGGGLFMFLRREVPLVSMMARSVLHSVDRDAYVRYRYASYPVAKTTLLEYLETRKRILIAREFTASENKTENGLAYARIALAAERAGESADAAHYMKLSKEAFRAEPHPWDDEAEIRSLVERLDKRWDDELAGKPAGR